MSKEKAEKLNLKPLVKIIAQASAAHAPEWFTTAPSKAIAKSIRKSKFEQPMILIYGKSMKLLRRLRWQQSMILILM